MSLPAPWATATTARPSGAGSNSADSSVSPNGMAISGVGALLHQAIHATLDPGLLGVEVSVHAHGVARRQVELQALVLARDIRPRTKVVAKGDVGPLPAAPGRTHVDLKRPHAVLVAE